MIRLTIYQVIKLYSKMIDVTGGEFGIRSHATLKSSLNNAFSTFDGKDLYSDVVDKIANTCFSIINNHPFLDGNKRMGVFVLLILLKLNSIEVRYSQKDLVFLGMGVAKGKLKQTDIVYWINRHKIEA